MKKIISIVLALVMMMAITVPAFAETAVLGDNNVNVETTFDETNDTSYTVTIPATQYVTWGDETATYDVSYSVTSQLLVGASIKVAVNYDLDTDDTNNGVMKATGTDKVLTYTLTGAGEATFGEVNDGAKASDVGGTDASITVTGFADAPVGTYTGTITYTVAYEA
jgi:hypothetical protein